MHWHQSEAKDCCTFGNSTYVCTAIVINFRFFLCLVSRFPLHDSVWLVLLAQTKNANSKVFQAVALALYYLAVDSGERESLGVCVCGGGGGGGGGGGEGGALHLHTCTHA